MPHTAPARTSPLLGKALKSPCAFVVGSDQSARRQWTGPASARLPRSRVKAALTKPSLTQTIERNWDMAGLWVTG